VMKTKRSEAAPPSWRIIDWTHPVFLFLFSSAFIAGIEWVADHTQWFAAFEGWGPRLLAGAVVWMLSIVLVLHRKVDDLAQQKEDVKETVRMCLALGATHGAIASLERNMRVVDLGRGAVLRGYCRKILDEAVDMSWNAAERNRILVQDHHFGTVEDVLGAFETGTQKEYRCVWSILNNDKAYDDHWKGYMQNLLEINNQQGQKIKLYVLVVVDDVKALDRSNIRTISGFMHQNPQIFDYSIIDKGRYQTRLRDAKLETNYGYFGIFGEVLMYRTIDEDEQTGEFTEHGPLIERYVRFHRDTMAARDEMKAREAIDKWLKGAGNISVDTFLDADGVESGSEVC